MVLKKEQKGCVTCFLKTIVKIMELLNINQLETFSVYD